MMHRGWCHPQHGGDNWHKKIAKWHHFPFQRFSYFCAMPVQPVPAEAGSEEQGAGISLFYAI
jgi:hypothetical protein